MFTDIYTENTSFENEQCQFQVEVVLAPFPPLSQPKSRDQVDTAPFTSDIDVTDFLTSQPQHNEGHNVDLAAIARRSSVLSTCLYTVQPSHDNTGKIGNNRVVHDCPIGADEGGNAIENVHNKRRRNHRSRRGCWTCRLRHKACPEDGSPCSACSRLNIRCDNDQTRPDTCRTRHTPQIVFGKFDLSRISSGDGIFGKRVEETGSGGTSQPVETISPVIITHSRFRCQDGTSLGSGTKTDCRCKGRKGRHILYPITRPPRER